VEIVLGTDCCSVVCTELDLASKQRDSSLPFDFYCKYFPLCIFRVLDTYISLCSLLNTV
jgi:hypothetical protein